MADLSTKTEALYQKEGHTYTHTSTVSSISPLSSLPQDAQALFKPPPDSDPYILTTPSTIFHAQGGGQPSDTGTITPANSNDNTTATPKFHVHQVRKLDPAILHLGIFSPLESRFTGQEEVLQSIDIPTRILHSRLHTAGHALGLAIYNLVQSGQLPADLKDGKASHYPGAAFVEFSGLIPGDKKAAIQAEVDELVARDLGVEIHFWSKEEAERGCIGGIDGAALSENEGVRVVDIGGVGRYPCGGTHVRTLKECGRVVVRNVKRQKGVSKVGYEVVDA